MASRRYRTMSQAIGITGFPAAEPLLDESVWRTQLRELFGIDLRSLAAVRIASGVIVLSDLINRLPDLAHHYSDQGVLPRWALLEKFSDANVISLHLISGLTWVQGVLFLLAGVFALAILVGYRSRLATGLTWFMLVSLQGRNPMILDCGDVLLRMILFWSMFLPTGARWSIDSAAGRYPQGSHLFLSPATLAMLLQLALMYVMSALYKSDPIWHDGSAIWYALQINAFVTPMGRWMMDFPQILHVLSHFVWWIELLGPIIIFLPFFNLRIRIAGVFAFWMLHAGMGMGLELGHFPYICAAAWLAFLPGRFWDLAIARRPMTALGERLTFFGRAVRWWIERGYSKPVRSMPLKSSPLCSGVATLMLIYVFLWNLRDYDRQDYAAYFPDRLDWVSGLTWVGQQWNMFSPRPMRDDGWFVIPAKLLNGNEIDLLTGRPVTWERPPLVSATFSNTRWRKYMLNIASVDNSDHRLYYARYLTRQWNNAHEEDEKVETFDIDFMRQPTTADGVRPAPEKLVLWQHHCFH